jgi:carbonic anhydrase
VGFHGTAAAIEFAVLNLNVKRIVVCGHSHCGAIRALYGEVPAAAQNLARWLDLGRGAALPVAQPGPEVLRRTEQRAIVLQLERLMDYPMVRERVEARTLGLHGWHYVIEDGEVHVFDVARGGFVPASQADNAGTGPYVLDSADMMLDSSGVPAG